MQIFVCSICPPFWIRRLLAPFPTSGSLVSQSLQSHSCTPFLNAWQKSCFFLLLWTQKNVAMKKSFYPSGNEWILTTQIDSMWEFLKAVRRLLVFYVQFSFSNVFRWNPDSRTLIFSNFPITRINSTCNFLSLVEHCNFFSNYSIFWTIFCFPRRFEKSGFHCSYLAWT